MRINVAMQMLKYLGVELPPIYGAVKRVILTLAEVSESSLQRLLRRSIKK